MCVISVTGYLRRTGLIFGDGMDIILLEGGRPARAGGVREESEDRGFLS